MTDQERAAVKTLVVDVAKRIALLTLDGTRRDCAEDQLCPGCGDAREEHDEQIGCRVHQQLPGEALEQVCICLLSQADIDCLYQRWLKEQIITELPDV